ncbi:zinc-dependent alcohol dehydrogenase [Streptomyces hesseae]|uniref:2-deoxy-scyllo-inosamine dehydrogenase n=1 Tax=Streptomyces hesseae TaxID=3075519 RepID=A0ABU2SJY8_9ACTN|nr:alcohol dehydrogenase catalytic domain-containing protein [Streptomyces sp. DSM 40473]MDT0449289.1 alcohol dehydrogenase catalytic domain-containing protein [Streptomyces sp. DSM 40473]
MRAAVLNGPRDLSVEAVPDPVLPEGWALVRVAYNAICGSDVSLYNDVWHGAALPAVPGHEWSGTVAETRSPLVSPGDVVAGDIALTCGHCSWCGRGQPVMCPELREFGFTDPGGCAEFIAVPARNLVRLPPDTDLLAATQTEPLAVALHALDRVRLEAGETVAVLGCGGIGLNVLQAARASGGRVVLAVDPVERRAAVAASLGARTALSSAGEVARWIEDAGPAGLPDVVLDACGEPDAIRLAAELVRPGGRVGLIGYRVGKRVEMPAAQWPLKLMSTIGVMGPGRFMRRAADLLVDGAVRTDQVITHVLGLSEADKAFRLADQPGPDVIRVVVRADG